MTGAQIFSRDKYIKVRGIPVERWEIEQFEQKFGGMLFDEALFMSNEAKRVAVANVVNALDKQLALMRRLARDPVYLPDYVDIGDRFWLYIPVGFGGVVSIPTRDKPAGVVGWFRVKRYL